MCLKCRVYMPLGGILLEDAPLVEFMYLAFTRMPGESYLRRLRPLLVYLCYVFRALITSLVCRLCKGRSQKGSYTGHTTAQWKPNATNHPFTRKQLKIGVQKVVDRHRNTGYYGIQNGKRFLSLQQPAVMGLTPYPSSER